MDRQATEMLARFCVQQRNAFDPDDWYQRSETDGKAVALAAKYLSMTSWYGHDEELVDIAAKIHPALASGAGLFGEAQSVGFDWSYLSTSVRIGIALQQLQQAVPAAQRELFERAPDTR